MAEIIRMPLLSDTMKEGVIAEWHKKIGDKVKADDILAEVETDKATMEVMPYVDGTLLYIGVEKGKGIPVNGIMAIIGKEGEDISQYLEEQSGSATPSAPAKASTTENAAPAPVAAPVNIDAQVVRMPLLSDTMKEGKIAAWLKNVGEDVKSDDVIAEVETDKATMEVMPYVDGTLLYIGVEAGGAVPVNGIMAIIGKKGTDVTPLLNAENNTSAAPATATAPSPAAPTASPIPEAATAPTPVVDEDNSRVKASPLAKKIAKEKGINLASLKGSGDGGRIIKRDIENYQPNAAAPAQTAANIPAAAGVESYTDKPLSQMRKVIAQRLSDSKFSAPHFYLNISVKMDNAMAARVQLNNVAPAKISFNDFVIKACAQALRKHKEINSSWMGDFIRENNHINIGTAVAIPDGLIVPVIKFADQKSLAEIAQESKSLVGKARDKKLQPHEFTGNTFTISNLGMMDIDDFTAIINPPDACILAVGRIEPTPVVEDNEIVIRNIMKLTLSCDHRVVDGASGAAFLQTLKGYLEQPVTMLI